MDFRDVKIIQFIPFVNDDDTKNRTEIFNEGCR